MEITKFYIDDGFTGADFDRPAFQQMIDDIYNGKINCVIVKDLSRIGREYIGTGRFMQKILPSMGVRFIAINDNYDSFDDRDKVLETMASIKNLINDNYCRDTSTKIRSVLKAKMENGDFVKNYCPYGYKKCEGNHNRIEPDIYAGTVVQDIFKWIIEGYSFYKIAEKLNAMGVKSPMDYRIENGEKINTHFKKGETAAWSHNAVKRIAENPVYIGTLIQGKSTTVNYKLKDKIINKGEDEWVIIENTMLHHK